MYMTEYNGLLWNGPRVECSEVRRWTRFVQNQAFWHYTTRMSVDWMVTTVSFFCVFGVLPRDVHEQWEKRRWGVLTGSPCLEGIRTQTLIERERERLGKTTTTTTTTGRTNKGSKERHTHTHRECETERALETNKERSSRISGRRKNATSQTKNERELDETRRNEPNREAYSSNRQQKEQEK